jgi:hypothetical protein
MSSHAAAYREETETETNNNTPLLGNRNRDNYVVEKNSIMWIDVVV